MRIFASDRVKNFMQALGMERGEAIEHRMVTNAIEKAQRKVEGRNFDIRKQLLEYDDVASDQRRVVYKQRADLLEADNVSEVIEAIREDVVTEVVASFIPPQSIDDQWDIPGLEQHIEAEFGMAMDIQQWLKDDKTLSEAGVRAKVLEQLGAAYQQKCEQVGEEIHRFEKHIMLQVLDGFWKEHLASMDHLRQGIHLRGYAGKNPKQEYKRESFELFEEMLGNIKHEVVNFLAKVQIRQQEEIDEAERVAREEQARLQKEFQHAQADSMSGTGSAGGESDASTEQPFVRNIKKVGRNEACPCGSGKKYKQCHGTLG
jgi:preprotein translocase subunit SecA